MGKSKTKTLRIKSCLECPHAKREQGGQGTISFMCEHPTQMRTVSWPGTKYPDERRGRMISERCERPSEYPTSFPEWCPL